MYRRTYTRPPSDKLAVLIDADNAQPALAAALLSEISRHGTATIKRAYGDWTTPNVRGWRDVLQSLAIQPVQQFRYTVGKNATDAALIIDAMDLLHDDVVDGFCIVSSDSDYTRLATRIREAGLAVYGFGERKTPQPFVAACDRFIYTEILAGGGASYPGPEASASPAPFAADAAVAPFEPMLRSAVAACARDNGWALLAAVGAMINKQNPSFDPRNYGVEKLGALVRQQPYVEIKEVPMGDGSTNVHLYVRLKDAA